MKPFPIFVCTTVAIAAGAWLATSSRDSATAASTGELLFPELEERINDVATLTIDSADSSFTLVRDGASWGMQEKGGYPVDDAKVKKLLFELRGAKRVEELTSDPARYGKLGVQDIDAEESKSARATVRDSAGQDLASLIVGNMRPKQGGFGTGSTSYYVRESGEAASWIVEGDIRLDRSENMWLKREALNVPRARVAAARVEHADGEVVFVSRPEGDERNYTVHDIPEGKEPKSPSIAMAFGNAIERFYFDDVVPRAEDGLEGEPLSTSTFWTDDGLVVTARMWEKDEKFYARFSAEATDEDPPIPLDSPIVTPTIDLEGTEATEPETGETDAGPPVAEAAEINATVGEWTYVVPSWKAATFKKRMDELVQDIPPPPEPETPEDTADGGEGDGMPVDPPVVEDDVTDETTGTEDEAIPTFDVVLEATGDDVESLVTGIRMVTQLGLEEAKALAEDLPNTILEGVSQAAADHAKNVLEDAGGTVKVEPGGSD